MISLHLGDCLDVLQTLPDDSVDAVVTDPPYGLSFMGKRWDYNVPAVDVWAECLRVLKPGGHLLAFAGTRTQHRMAVRIEDAGFEIRDMIAWVYGSGFPKSLDVSKAIDKAAGATREVVGVNAAAVRKPKRDTTWTGDVWGDNGATITAPATDSARQWQGWGTALKPSMEPITVARKPLIGTVAENVLMHGTGAINVDGCRVAMAIGDTKGEFGPRSMGIGENNTKGIYGVGFARQDADESKGRWPANMIHDGSDEVVGLFPQSKSDGGTKGGANGSVYANGKGIPHPEFFHYSDSGSAARFFYCAKASKSDRDEGCEGLEAQNNMRVNGPRESEEAKHATKRSNHHPTVKPTALMRYLCRLVTPPGGIVLDPFMGSGSTGKACVLEGFGFVGIEREPEYMAIAQARIDAVQSPFFREAIAVNAPAPTPKPTPASPIEQLSMFE